MTCVAWVGLAIVICVLGGIGTRGGGGEAGCWEKGMHVVFIWEITYTIRHNVRMPV